MTRIARRVVEMDAKGYTPAQIARHLRLAEDVVWSLLIAHATRLETR